jgi:hypothetical protein
VTALPPLVAFDRRATIGAVVALGVGGAVMFVVVVGGGAEGGAVAAFLLQAVNIKASAIENLFKKLAFIFLQFLPPIATLMHD